MAVSKCLHNLRLVQKAVNQLPHELSKQQLEKRKTICEMLLLRCERKSFLHRIMTGKNGFIMKVINNKSDAVYLMGSRRYDIPRVAETWLNDHSSPEVPNAKVS